MTLYDLANGTIVQGNIKLSVFVDGEEKSREEYRMCADLSLESIEPYEDLEVEYMYVGEDGSLHIELGFSLSGLRLLRRVK